MGYIRQTYLGDVIRAAGVTVVEVTDPVTGRPWQTHAAKQPGERTYEPVGLANHHTASVGNYPNKPWYPVDKLRIKCNLNIKPDGIVYVISAGYQYDSGYGDRMVLAAVRGDRPAPTPTDTYTNGKPAGSNPGVLLNPWFIDIECDHPGDGRPITDAQYEALVKTNAAILTYNSWGLHRLKGHLELTRRKIDPFWNDDRHAMKRVRSDTLNAMEAPDMTTGTKQTNGYAETTDSVTVEPREWTEVLRLDSPDPKVSLLWAATARFAADDTMKQCFLRFVRDPDGIHDFTGTADKTATPGKQFIRAVWPFANSGPSVSIEAWHDAAGPVDVESAQLKQKWL